MNWKFEGSSEESSWEIFDEQKENSILVGPSIFHTFHIENQSHKQYKYIRLHQTGYHSYTKDYYIIYLLF